MQRGLARRQPTVVLFFLIKTADTTLLHHLLSILRESGMMGPSPVLSKSFCSIELSPS